MLYPRFIFVGAPGFPNAVYVPRYVLLPDVPLLILNLWSIWL